MMADIGITKFRVQIPRDGATPSTPGFAQSEGQDPVNPPGSPTGIYVPYLGATGDVNLGEYGLTTGNLVFDTTPTNIPTAQGAMYWDVDDETVALIMNGAIQKVGEDSFYQVKNQTGSNIAKGVAVRFAGTVGASGRLLIAPFLADGTYPSTYFMGVTMEAIANGEDGKVMWFGRIRGINTNAYNEGDILYASTTVAGGFQTTVPQAPNNIVEVCAVVTKSATVGTIFVRPTLGSNINRDEGVKITSPLTGDLLQLQASGLWENKSLASIGIYQEQPFQVVSTSGTITDLVATSNRIVFTGTNPVIDGITGGVNGKTLQILFLGSGILTYGVGGAGANQFNVNGLNVLGFGASNEIVYYDNKWRSNDGLGQVLLINPTNNFQNIKYKVGINRTFVGGGGTLLLAPTTGSNSCLDIYDTGGTLTGYWDGSGTVICRGVSISDSYNLSVGTSTGTKIGTATSQKLGFWNVTPIVQPTTGVASSTRVGGGGTTLTDTDTFDGYTLAQVVKALRNAGLLA